jgi:rsbT co-antagonist protein RsbR
MIWNQCVILPCGIRPEVAQTLIGLGADLRDIITQSTLQNSIAYALRWRAGQQ